MAISTNLLLKNASGKISDDLVIKQYGDKTVISVYPNMSRVKFSKKQKSHQQQVRKANAYALGIMEDLTLAGEAQIRLNVTRNKLYTSLIKEYFRNLKEQAAATAKK